MKLKVILFSCFILSFGILKAQNDFRPGYIIEHSGDTLFGQIDYRGDLHMSNACKFKSSDKTVQEYSPKEIRAYRFDEGKFYVSREVDNKMVFLEYLIKGTVNVYYLRDNSGDHYFFDKKGQPMVEIPYEEGIKYVDERKVYYESKNHIGLLKYYMQDAPGVQSQIQSIRKPEHKNLIKLAENYHKAVCEDEECIVYEKNAPMFKIIPEIVGGVINYTGVEDLVDKNYTHVGLIAHIWMPRLNEKIYFRTGVLRSELVFDVFYYDDIIENYYKIPFQLEYIFPKGIIRPRMAYGMNYYVRKYFTVSFNLGANVKITDTFFLSATTDIEYRPSLFIIPNKFLSYSLKMGLFINL